MLMTNEIKVGTAFMYEGAPLIVQKMLGQKSGRQGMVTKLRVANIVTGGTQDLGLDAGEKFEEVELVEKNVKLSYIDGNDYHFMDQETYDDITLEKDYLGDNAGYISPDDDYEVKVTYYNEPHRNRYTRRFIRRARKGLIRTEFLYCHTDSILLRKIHFVWYFFMQAVSLFRSDQRIALLFLFSCTFLQNLLAWNIFPVLP